MPVEKKCVVCGNRFSVPPCRAESAKACSNECAIAVRAKSRERKVEKTCPGCGFKFELPRSHKGRRTYCSNECRYKSDHSVAKQSLLRSGDKNPAWVGGETKHSDGYLYKYSPMHPYAFQNRYVFGHRLEIEKMLKEKCHSSTMLISLGENLYLSPSVVVHHLDTVKGNNRRGNLTAFYSSSSHRAYHNGTMPKKHEHWPNDDDTRAKLLKYLNSSIKKTL